MISPKMEPCLERWVRDAYPHTYSLCVTDRRGPVPEGGTGGGVCLWGSPSGEAPHSSPLPPGPAAHTD